MTRKDGLLALLVVVVGLNFVVIKLIGQYAADAGGPALYAGRLPALLFVARPAIIPLRLLLGYGLTISFGQFAFLFCAIGLACRRGWRRWCCRRKPLPSFLAPSSLANAYRASSWRDRAGDLRRAGAGGGEPRRGACPTGALC